MACSAEAMSHATGKLKPRAAKRLYVENKKPKSIDVIAAIDVPLLHRNPKTKGINAPVVRKSDPIQAIVNTDLISNAINNATAAIISVETLPTITSWVGVDFGYKYFL